MSNIFYQHYRPRKGLLEGLGIKKGSTPEEHVRRYYRGANQEWEADPKGGLTYCFLETAQGMQFSGKGNCSVTDVFCFATGRQFAFKAAVQAMLQDKGIQDITTVKDVTLEGGIIAFMMPLVHGITVARYLKTFLNTSYFSDDARTELYKALQNVYVHGAYSQD